MCETCARSMAGGGGWCYGQDDRWREINAHRCSDVLHDIAGETDAPRRSGSASKPRCNTSRPLWLRTGCSTARLIDCARVKPPPSAARAAIAKSCAPVERSVPCVIRVRGGGGGVCERDTERLSLLASYRMWGGGESVISSFSSSPVHALHASPGRTTTAACCY